MSGIGIFQTHYKTVGRIQIGEPKQEFMVLFDTGRHGGQWEIVCFDLTSENLGSPDFWIRSIECDPYFCSRLFVFTVLTDIFWPKYIRDRVNGIKFFHCSKNFFKLRRKYLYITKIKRITWTAELIAGQQRTELITHKNIRNSSIF